MSPLVATIRATMSVDIDVDLDDPVLKFQRSQHRDV